MHNQITFMFSKECHGDILYMHLTKFHKSEKWKNQKTIFNKFKINYSLVHIGEIKLFALKWGNYSIRIIFL